MSITPREDLVMDLWEAGRTKAQIVEATGLSPDTVKRILGYMVDTTMERRQSGSPAIRAADARFVAALQASGGHFL